MAPRLVRVVRVTAAAGLVGRGVARAAQVAAVPVQPLAGLLAAVPSFARPQFDEELREVLQVASGHARRARRPGGQHDLALALVRVDAGRAALRRCGLDPDAVHASLPAVPPAPALQADPVAPGQMSEELGRLLGGALDLALRRHARRVLVEHVLVALLQDGRPEIRSALTATARG